ncbi:MAG: hypothetical protein KDD11_14920 [Acidobacteria bacterium]|nr:hypothetical protein [Acidobacteriota bacterium]
MISARAWCRVDLAGGTLDLWPLGLLHEGASTVNLAVDLAVRASLRHSTDGGWRVVQGGEEHRAGDRSDLLHHPETALVGHVAETLDLPPLEVSLSSASPRGGGLGASSALAVALLAAGEAWLGRPASSASALAAVARDLEARMMNLPTGTQDHYGAQLGGALVLTYPPGGVRVRRLDAVDLEALGKCLVIAYSGQSHFSAGKNWQVVKRRLDGDPEAIATFAGIAAAAAALAEALEAGDLPRVGALVAEEWRHRRRLAEGVSTPGLEAMLAAAREAGAWGGKACGAGGGGCLAVLCPQKRRAAVAQALVAAGAEILEAAPTALPLEITRS